MYGYPYGSGMAVTTPYPDPALQQQNTAKFEPSKSLRDLITERMEEQQECLTNRQEQIAGFLQISWAASGNPNRKKGPGDEQISAETSQCVTGYSTTALREGIPMTSVRRSSARDDYDEYVRLSMKYATPASWRPQPPHPPKKKISKKKDPMGRYWQLEEEMQALMELSPAMRDPLPNSMKTPQALASTLNRNILTKILGTGQIPGDEESDDEGGQAVVAPPQQMIASVPPGMPTQILSPQASQPQFLPALPPHGGQQMPAPMMGLGMPPGMPQGPAPMNVFSGPGPMGQDG